MSKTVDEKLHDLTERCKALEAKLNAFIELQINFDIDVMDRIQDESLIEKYTVSFKQYRFQK